MTEIKRDLHEDLKIMTLIPKDPNEPVDMVHDVVTPHALRRAIAAEKEVERLTAEVEKQAQLKHEIYRANEVWQEQYEKGQTEVVRLQKALDLAHSHLTYGGVSEALECISDALGEEVES